MEINRVYSITRFYGRIAKDGTSHEAAALDAIRHNVEGLAGLCILYSRRKICYCKAFVGLGTILPLTAC